MRGPLIGGGVDGVERGEKRLGLGGMVYMETWWPPRNQPMCPPPSCGALPGLML